MKSTYLAQTRVKLLEDAAGRWHVVNADSYQRYATKASEAEALACAADAGWFVVNPRPVDWEPA
jgi:hypothetical protein